MKKCLVTYAQYMTEKLKKEKTELDRLIGEIDIVTDFNLLFEKLSESYNYVTSSIDNLTEESSSEDFEKFYSELMTLDMEITKVYELFEDVLD
nr:MAG TPA: hypothetical protein [Caudoviricetes sp.]